MVTFVRPSKVCKKASHQHIHSKSWKMEDYALFTLAQFIKMKFGYLVLISFILLPITVKALYHQPKVVVFSSIKKLYSTLADLDIDIQYLYDNELESIDFNASCLKPSTFQMLKEAEILITEPKILANILEYNPDILQKLRWCQSTFAGVDAIFKSNTLKAWKDSKQRDTPFPFIITRISGCFGQPIAEWVIGRIISFERNFKLMDENQVKRKWGENLGVLKSYRNLSDLTLVILGGCGDIGSCIGKVAKLGFGMKVIAYTKHSRTNAPNGVDECTSDLSQALKSADYLVSVLPSTPETRGLLSRNLLKKASTACGGKSPVFLNCGRGDVINESILIEALEKGYLKAAILDVFATEPLPSTSELWNRKDVLISPHVSGVTKPCMVPNIFQKNYERFIQGEKMSFVVDWESGY